MHAEAARLRRIWSVQWIAFFLFVVGAIAVGKAQLPVWWGFIPGAVGAVWALFAFGQRRHMLGVVVALLSLLGFVSLFNQLRYFPTHAIILPGDQEVRVGDPVPISDLKRI